MQDGEVLLLLLLLLLPSSSPIFVQAAAASTLHNMGLLFKNTGRLEEAVQA
jgi:hypothetical protein